MERFRLWEDLPKVNDDAPLLEYYPTKNKKTDSTIVICPGGGYDHRTIHEGKGYAEFLNELGMDAFVLQYRLSPYTFPVEIIDARRGIRFVRANAERFGINPNKVGIMGSSAGGHLAALTCTYRGQISGEKTDSIDEMEYLPDFQILCYPVIDISDLSVTHIGSTLNFLGATSEELKNSQIVNPVTIADEKTPKAFIWHTSNDETVNVINSLRYGEKLRNMGVPFEMHIFPEGRHGLGLAKDDKYVSQWTKLLVKWLEVNKYI